MNKLGLGMVVMALTATAAASGGRYDSSADREAIRARAVGTLDGDAAVSGASAAIDEARSAAGAENVRAAQDSSDQLFRIPPGPVNLSNREECRPPFYAGGPTQPVPVGFTWVRRVHHYEADSPFGFGGCGGEALYSCTSTGVSASILSSEDCSSGE